MLTSQLKSGENGKKKKATYYSEEFKTTVVNDVLLGKYTKEEARRLYGIKAKSAVLDWVTKHLCWVTKCLCRVTKMSI